MSTPVDVHVGVELGGTKVIVATSAAEAPGRVLARHTIPTTSPRRTLDAVGEAMRVAVADNRALTVGIGSFGPLDLRHASDRYGTMLNTPKQGWSGVDVFGEIRGHASALGVSQAAIDTDVAAALAGERQFGAASGAKGAMYMTVGTGIGAAFTANGPVSGANHSEAGHVWVPGHPGDPYAGRCPYHGGCLEGMASGPAIEDRFGDRLENMDESDSAAALDLIAWYVGHGLVSLLAAVPVTLVVIGGGVSKVPGFHAAVAAAAADAAAGYPPVPFESGELRIVPPGLGDDAGVVGAIEIGRSRT